MTSACLNACQHTWTLCIWFCTCTRLLNWSSNTAWWLPTHVDIDDGTGLQHHRSTAVSPRFEQIWIIGTHHWERRRRVRFSYTRFYNLILTTTKCRAPSTTPASNRNPLSGNKIEGRHRNNASTTGFPPVLPSAAAWTSVQMIIGESLWNVVMTYL